MFQRCIRTIIVKLAFVPGQYNKMSYYSNKIIIMKPLRIESKNAIDSINYYRGLSMTL